MDYKEMIDNMREYSAFGLPPEECKRVAGAIETLLAERDAAVEDLAKAESCKTCGNMSSWCADNPDMCMGYKWRGPRPKKES